MNSAEMVKQDQSLTEAALCTPDDEDEMLKESAEAKQGQGLDQVPDISAADDLLNDADPESKANNQLTITNESSSDVNDPSDGPKEAEKEKVEGKDAEADKSTEKLPAASVGAFLEQLRKQQLETATASSSVGADKCRNEATVGEAAGSEGLRKRKRAHSDSDRPNDVKSAKREDCQLNSNANCNTRLRRASSALLERRSTMRDELASETAAVGKSKAIESQPSIAAAATQLQQSVPAQSAAAESGVTNAGVSLNANRLQQNGGTKVNDGGSRPDVPKPATGANASTSQLVGRNAAAGISNKPAMSSANANNGLIAQQQLLTSIIRQQQQNALLAQLGLPTIALNGGGALQQMQLQQQLAQAAAIQQQQQQQQQQVFAVLQQAAALQQQRIAQAQAAQMAAIQQLQAQAQQAAQMQAAAQAQAHAQAQAQAQAVQLHLQQQAQLATLAQYGFTAQPNSMGSQSGLAGLGFLSAGHNVGGLSGQVSGVSGGLSALSGLAAGTQAGLTAQGGTMAPLNGLVQPAASQSNASQLALLQQQAMAQATAQQLLAQAQQTQQAQVHPAAGAANVNVGVSSAQALGYSLVPGAQGASASQIAGTNANALMQLGLLGQSGQSAQAQAQALYAAAAAQSGQAAAADLGQLVLGPNGQLMRLMKPTNTATQLRM